MLEPLGFLYVDRSALEALKSGKPISFTMAKHRRDDADLVRVVIAEAPPSCYDRAWDSMTEHERDALRFGGYSDKIPSLEDIEALAGYLSDKAAHLASAADKLAAAARELEKA